jgi:hypothetical protein
MRVQVDVYYSQEDGGPQAPQARFRLNVLFCRSPIIDFWTNDPSEVAWMVKEAIERPGD